MIKQLFILTIVLTFLAACKKKSDYVYDREGELVTDTATYMLSATYVANTATQLTVELNMVTLNGLQCEETYPTNLFKDTLNDPNYSMDFSNVSSWDVLQATSYSSALVLNTNNRKWFGDHYMGYYMRRYFEQIEEIPTSRAGIVKLDIVGGDNEMWYDEYPGSHFTNGWKFNTESFYEITRALEGYNSSGQHSNGNNFKVALDNLIDDIISDPQAGAEKSITIFTDLDFQGSQASDAENDALVAKAKANGVKINFIGPRLPDLSIRLASETGGFICENYNAVEELDPYHYLDDPVQDLAVFAENLNLILSHDVTRYSCKVVISQSGSDTFLSGQRYYFHFVYGDELFRFTVLIP